MTGTLARHARLVRSVALYELRKATAFRVGFLVREVMRGVNRPAVMILVYLAMMRSSGQERLGDFTFPELMSYLILVATFHKVVLHERAFELSQQIFEGYITKYLVMPVRYFSLVLGRHVQYTVLQVAVAALFYATGAVLVPGHWPRPASLVAAVEALCLVVIGSYCFLLMFYIIHTLAFWLDVVWTLLVGSRFVTDFIAGTIVPVALMPPGVQRVFHWLFPYWTLSAPIEIFMGRLPSDAFWRGLAVLLGSAVVLELVRATLWRRGIRRYAGSGM